MLAVTSLTRHCTCRPVALLGMVLYTIWCIYAAGAALRFMVNMVYLELTCRTHRFASFVVSAIRNITFLTYLVHATHATAAWWYTRHCCVVVVVVWSLTDVCVFSLGRAWVEQVVQWGVFHIVVFLWQRPCAVTVVEIFIAPVVGFTAYWLIRWVCMHACLAACGDCC